MKIKAKELNATHIGMIYRHKYSTNQRYDFVIDKITIKDGYVDIQGVNVDKGFRDSTGPAFETEIVLIPQARKFTIEIDENELKTILNWYSFYSNNISDDYNEAVARKLEGYEHAK